MLKDSNVFSKFYQNNSYYIKLNQLINRSDLSYRLARGVIWVIIGSIIAKAITLVISIIFAKSLGKTGFGEYGIIISTVALFSSFASAWPVSTTIRYVAEFRESNKPKVCRILTLINLITFIVVSIFTVLMITFAPIIAGKLLGAPQLMHILRIASLLLFIGSFTGIQNAALVGLEAFKDIAKMNIIVAIISLPISMISVWKWGLEGIIYASIIISAINWVYNHILLRMKYSIKFESKGCFSEGRILWNLSLPSFLGSIVVTPIIWLSNTILVNHPGGYAEMGLFNAANQWKTLVMFFPLLLGQVISPILSECYSNGNLDSVSKIIKFSIIACIITTLPICIFFSSISSTIMRQYGASFADGNVILIVVLATTFILSLQTPVAPILIASEKMWIGFFMNLVWASIFILTFLLLQKYEALGLALAYLISYTFHSIWGLSYGIMIIKRRVIQKNLFY